MAEIDPLPSRDAWEEPPPQGWGSALPGLGIEILLFISSGAGVVAAVRLIHLARKLGAGQIAGFRYVVVIALWALICLLASALVVYLWRSMGGLAFLSAMLTDYGRVHRFGGRPPVWLDTPPDNALRVLHLSDLHVAEGPRVRMIERPRPAGNAHLAPLLDRPEMAETDIVLFTGDVTDRGTAHAWRCFLEALEERGLDDIAILVPGNHDIAYADAISGRQVLRSDRFGIVQLGNLLKFCEAFADTFGGREGLVLDGVTHRPARFAEAWALAEAEVRPLLADLPTKPIPAPRTPARREYVSRIEQARARLLELFPVAIPVDSRGAVVFVLNSSTDVSRHPALNALGNVGRAQYRRLEQLAPFFPQALKLVALHHHVVRRFEERASGFMARLFAKFTVLGDPRPLVRFCERHRVRAILNGHRHLSYQLRLGCGTVLLAAPSSTMGDELAQDPRLQFERYDFPADGEGIYRRPVHFTSPR